MALLNEALEYVDKGLLSVKYHPFDNRFSLFCYTQDCFFGKDTWDEVTKTHRGTLYFEGKQVNKPFDKIFNLNEHPETSEDIVLEEMKTRPYEIYDKANGHLFIVSCFTDDEGEQHVLFSTKGSFDSEMVQRDILLFADRYGEQFDVLLNEVEYLKDSTFMFEAIVEHDKHTLWDKQVADYGENSFVLLGINVKEESGEWRELYHDSLKTVSTFLTCPVVNRYSDVEDSITEWKNHTGIEGYVVMFPETESGLPVKRVKVKTTEYWKLRFKNDLSPERIVNMFRAGGFQRMEYKLPEEVVDNVIPIIEHEYRRWYYDKLIDLTEEDIQRLSKISFKDLASDQTISKAQFDYIVKVKRDKLTLPSEQSKEMRTMFYNYMWSLHFDPVKNEINKVIDNL